MSETPLMAQYRSIKAEHTDKILFFRLGDFYEMFDEDAVEVSSILSLTLTHRGDSPMCGIPYHAAQNYIKRLIDAGKKIAVCEQLEIPRDGKTLARREVVRVITPATAIDNEFLANEQLNYILSVFRESCAWCDVSTGEFRLKYLEHGNKIHSLRIMIEQLSPREVLVCDDEYFSEPDLKECVDSSGSMVTKLPVWYFNIGDSYKLLCKVAGVSSLSSYGMNPDDIFICPAGALMKYVQNMSGASVKHLTDYRVERDKDYLGIDDSSRRNLELFANLRDGSSRNSLFDVINKCRTSGGTRLLKSWLSFPLKDIRAIRDRQEKTNFFYNDSAELSRIRKLIPTAADLSRITGRTVMGRAVPHDLTALAKSVSVFIEIVSVHSDFYLTLFTGSMSDSALINEIVEFAAEINRAVNPDYLGQFKPGDVILGGYDAELDEKRNIHIKSNDYLNSYLEEEKAASGLTILKLGYNRVFGYYLEVPKGQVSHVPSHFIRKQTLVNGERFTTEKLEKLENEILLAQESATERETLLFRNLIEKASSYYAVLNEIGRFLNTVDVFQALASLALDSSYCCPQMTEDDTLKITNGRHPVVEHVLGPGKFVPNNLDMSTRFFLITGPNMAGKSTYLRQNALIILLAHIGSFVPAEKAEIGIVDQIFCRVGASDNLSGGESTFLVEMQETAFILRSCTERSFVIVDEIGRGTSTQDGMSIAWAVMKNLIEKKCMTLFSTHYHELTQFDNRGIGLLTLEVREDGKEIVFLRKVIEGISNSSYGIHVAKMAGVPESVLRNARMFRKKFFADYNPETAAEGNLFAGNDDGGKPENRELMSVIDSIKDCNLNTLTPVQAMLFLSSLKEKVDDVRVQPEE